MEALSIFGRHALHGTVAVSGAKNSALPILAACLLVGGEHIIENCPDITDIRTACRLLEELGCAVARTGVTLHLDTRAAVPGRIRPELLQAMRAGVLFQGALYARFGTGELSQPGGCSLGERPIDLHLRALEALGAQITESEGRFLLERRGPDGGFCSFPYPSVGATENALLTAAAAGNDTVLLGCACEPEITDLADFLNACGASVTGAGTSCIIVRGGRILRGARHRIIPDRMEAVSFLCAALACGGEITLTDTAPAAYAAERELLETAGCRFRAAETGLTMTAPERPEPIPLAATGPWPRFSTDAQPLLMAALLRAEGVSRFCETVFEHRFGYTEELRKLGANIEVIGR